MKNETIVYKFPCGNKHKSYHHFNEKSIVTWWYENGNKNIQFESNKYKRANGIFQNWHRNEARIIISPKNLGRDHGSGIIFKYEI